MTDLTAEEDALARARRGIDFIQRVTELAHAAQLPPEFVLTLFGAFAKKIVDGGIATGGEPEAEIQWAMSAFMRGMGLQVATSRIERPERH